MQLASAHPLPVFFVLSYAISWIFFVPMVSAGVLKPPLIVLATFGPTLAAIATHRLGSGSFRAFRFFTTWPRVILGTTLSILLVVVAFVVAPALIVANPRELHWSVLLSAQVFNASTLLGGPLGEEPGWRGYALPRLEERFGPVRAALLMGVLWAGWHLPLFLIPGWSSSPIGTYVLIQIGLSVILTLSANVARFGVISAVAGHAAFNTVSRWLAGLFAGVDIRAQVSMVTLLALCGLGTALVLVAVTKGTLAFPRGGQHARREDRFGVR